MFERARAKQNTLTLLAFFWLVFCHPYYLCWELFGFKSCNLKTECYLYVKLLLYHYYKIHQHMLIWLLLQYAHCCNNINQLFYKIIYIYKTFDNVYTTDLSLQQFFYHCEEGVLKFLWYAKMRRLFAPSLSQHTVKIVHNI